MSLTRVTSFVLASLLATSVAAQEVWITQSLPFVKYESTGKGHVIERSQDLSARLSGSFAKTSRVCPPFCVVPMVAAPGVQTVGELELVQFLRTTLSRGEGLLIDARLPEWFERGSIPGAVNLPFNLVQSEANPFLGATLAQLGARELGGGVGYDFTNAKVLLLFGNGAWSAQAQTAVRHLVNLGYPADKILYYRGGLQSWLSLGFNTTAPGAS